MNGKTKATFNTMVIAIISTVVFMMLNLVYNNYIIRNYGSDVNGLVSTLTQFVSLFTIIEGGYTTAAIVATYDPLVNKDYSKLNDILYTTKVFLRRISIYIFIIVSVMGGIYLININSPISSIKTVSILLLSILTTTVSICFLSRYSVLMQCVNRDYIQTFIALFVRVGTWIIAMLLISYRADIVIVYSVNLINTIINILLIKFYEKKHFKFATYKGEYRKELIVGTADVFFQKIAGTIFTSTDLVLISLFLSFKHASVYNLYFQIFRTTMSCIVSIAQAPFNSFGQLYNEGNSFDRFKEYFDIYQHIVLILSTIIISVIGMMVIPFLGVYTSRIHDFNYIYPSLAILFYSQIFVQCVNRPYGTVLNVTGNFKMQNIQCGWSVVINIIISIGFIRNFGMNSIILGSFAGTLIILVMNIHQAYTRVLRISNLRIYKNIICNYIFGLFSIILSFRFYKFIINSYWKLMIIGVVTAVVFAVLVILVNIIIDKKTMCNVSNYLKSKYLENKMFK